MWVKGGFFSCQIFINFFFSRIGCVAVGGRGPFHNGGWRWGDPGGAAGCKITTYNVRGLSTPQKRRRLMGDLKRDATQIAFIQETYFRKDAVPKLYNKDFPWAYHATSPIAKSKGVSILISSAMNWTLKEELADPMGRFVLVKGWIGRVEVTLVNVYFPNYEHVMFLQKMIPVVLEFREGHLVMGGDFNYAPEPLLDTSKRSSYMSFAKLRRLQKEISLLGLIDPWRLMHPGERNYTFYSPIHKAYSRIDRILVTQADLPLVTDSDIGDFSISDHFPVYVSIEWESKNCSPRSWRINEALLQSSETEGKIDEALHNYFLENTSESLSPSTIWEAHKCVIRGVLIQLGAQRKREREAKIKEYLTKIEHLSRQHKRTLAEAHLIPLMRVREELNQILFQKTVRNMLWLKRHLYEYANKPGAMLARALRGPKRRTQILRLRNTKGGEVHTSADIAEEFCSFYRSLYNLPEIGSKKSPEKGKQIEEYLRDSGMRTLSEDQVLTLEGEI